MSSTSGSNSRNLVSIVSLRSLSLIKKGGPGPTSQGFGYEWNGASIAVKSGRKGARSGLQEEGHGAVVDELDRHPRAEHASLRAEALAEPLVERFGLRRRGRSHVARAVALLSVGEQGELAHAKHLPLTKGVVHPAVGIIE